ncbi:MAG: helix-turn-helix transcriptional regulator [Anaerolineae bacterium]
MPTRNVLLLTVGQNIRAARVAQGLSQEDLALKAHLDRTYVGGVERGERNLGMINLCRIASALGVLPADLLQNVVYAPERGDDS